LKKKRSSAASYTKRRIYFKGGASGRRKVNRPSSNLGYINNPLRMT
jgi:hypothetical protein